MKILNSLNLDSIPNEELQKKLNDFDSLAQSLQPENEEENFLCFIMNFKDNPTKYITHDIYWIYDHWMDITNEEKELPLTIILASISTEEINSSMELLKRLREDELKINLMTQIILLRLDDKFEDLLENLECMLAESLGFDNENATVDTFDELTILLTQTAQYAGWNPIYTHVRHFSID